MDYPKIAIILPYYGKWPSYFDLYLKSCEHNSGVDFIFFTDCIIPNNSPRNVFYHKSTIEDFNRLATEKTGVSVQVVSSYKVCDIRPAFGHIYEDYLRNYDYWGFGDIDLFYGDILKFISKNIPENEVVSFRPHWVSGGFSLFKNIEYINHLYRESIDWRNAFTTPIHSSFGECHKLWERIRKGEDILEIDEKESFSYLVKKSQKEDKLKAVFFDLLKESIPRSSYVLVESGRVSEMPSGQEYILYHMVTEKKSQAFVLPKWETVPDRYIIDRTGFYLMSEYVGISLLLKKSIRLLKGGIKKGFFNIRKVKNKISF